MTQEELDALMRGDIDLDEGYEEEDFPPFGAGDTDKTPYSEPDISALHSWPPPLSGNDSAMAHPSGDADREEEPKASGILDLIKEISHDLSDGEKQAEAIRAVIQSNIGLFETLCTKFPHIEAFQTQLSKNKEVSKTLEGILGMLQNGKDTIMNVTDIMHYQDTRRHRIEQGIDAMCALAVYMDHLSAGHLPDDAVSGNSMKNDGIEALIEAFWKK